MYVLFGDSNFTARLAPALMGAGDDPDVLAAAARCSARPAAFGAAALFAFGPSYLYFGRFAREDIYIAAITLGLRGRDLALHRPPAHVSPGDHRRAAGGVLRDQGDDVHHGLRDGLVLPVLVRDPALARRSSSARSSAPAGRAGAGSWPRSPGSFTLLFTTFLTHPGGLWDGVYTGLKYWLDQHGVARGGEPWQFYLTVLVTIEWPALILGAIGAVSLWRRNTLLRRLPDLGLLRLAGRLLVGGREVRLARPAPAAAAGPARRRRPAGDLADARGAALRRARGAPRSRCSTSASPRGGSTSTAAPTRARCSSPPSPRPTSRRSPTRSWRWPTAAARASRR